MLFLGIDAKGEIINFYDINKIMFFDWFFSIILHARSLPASSSSAETATPKFSFANA